MKSTYIPLFATVALAVVSISSAARTGKPNIILFVADDEGWANVNWHNPNHTLTPNSYAALKDGVELDRHYVFWYCSPTRSSLMTGRLPLHVSEDNGNAGTFLGAVPANMTMIAAKLSSVGYKTHHVGKWHLGNIRRALVPGARGFDTSLGYLGGAEDHYTQTNGGCGCGNSVDIWDTDKPGYGLNGTYGAFTFNKRAIDVIQQHDAREPLFMYIAAQNLHAPQQVPESYQNKFSSSEYSDAYRIEQGMGNCADELLGNVTSALKAAGLWEDTLFVYTSDNGGPTSEKVSGSSANNFPHRGGKRTAWEGGVRVNAFVSGGFVPQSMRGSKLEGYIHAADWYPTFAKLAGADPSDNVTGIPPVDGIDMWPYLTGEVTDSPRTEIPLISGSRGSLIMGDYKIIRGSQDYAFWTGPVYPNASTTHKNEPAFDCGTGCLFNIKEDPCEYNDLSKSQPDIFKQLLDRAMEIDQTAYLPNRGQGDKQGCCDFQKAHQGFSGPYLP